MVNIKFINKNENIFWLPAFVSNEVEAIMVSSLHAMKHPGFFCTFVR